MNIRHAILGTLLATLAACGGGVSVRGVGGGAAAPTAFNTAEFQANYGLANIGALTAYDNGATGTGITVAVIDTGIDVNNQEFSGRIAPASIDIVFNDPSTVQDVLGHGTWVSGVIAAARNGNDTHGVAFESTILAIRTESSGALTFTDDNIAAGIDHAVANGAQIINLSLGGGALPNAALQTSLQNAVNAGVIIIMAAGNDGGQGVTEVIVPARLANCSSILVCNLSGGAFDAQGRMISVGSVDSNNALSPFSNPAGDTASAHVMAPGSDIVVVNLLSNGGGTALVSGTSFSAPHVTGAIALLLQRFPSLTSQQVVDLVLSTAADLGATGTDTVFGRGLLNLLAAFQAQGVAALAMSDSVEGPREDLTKTTISLGPAFGNALSNEGFLALAIILDSYDRPYRVDLRNRVVAALRESPVQSFLDSPMRRIELASLEGMSLAMNLSPIDAHSETSRRLFNDEREEVRFESLQFSANVMTDTNLRVGFDTSPAWQHSELSEIGADSSLFFATEMASAPQLTMLGNGSGFTVEGMLDDSTRASFSLSTSAGQGNTGAGDGTLAQFVLRRDQGNGNQLGVGFGLLQERDALFRTTATGAFEEPDNTRSGFLTLSGTKSLTPSIKLQLSYTEAWADPSKVEYGFLNNWSLVRSNAVALSLIAEDVLADGDRLGFMIGQPLRVYRARADLTLPVSRDLEGFVQHETRRIDVTPDGREIDLQVAYQIRLSDMLTASSFTTLMLNPGHDNDEDASASAGVKLKLRF